MEVEDPPHLLETEDSEDEGQGRVPGPAAVVQAGPGNMVGQGEWRPRSCRTGLIQLRGQGRGQVGGQHSSRAQLYNVHAQAVGLSHLQVGHHLSDQHRKQSLPVPTQVLGVPRHHLQSRTSRAQWHLQCLVTYTVITSSKLGPIQPCWVQITFTVITIWVTLQLSLASGSPTL